MTGEQCIPRNASNASFCLIPIDRPRMVHTNTWHHLLCCLPNPAVCIESVDFEYEQLYEPNSTDECDELTKV
jgi:hypothetical protein